MKSIPITPEQRTEQELINLSETVKELKNTIKAQNEAIEVLKYELFKSLNEIKENQYLQMKMQTDNIKDESNSTNNSRERK